MASAVLFDRTKTLLLVWVFVNLQKNTTDGSHDGDDDDRLQEKYIKLAMLAWRGLNPRLNASKVPSA